MKVLRYGNRKSDGDTLWDISTPDREDAAFLCLFNLLKHSWDAYFDLEHPDQHYSMGQYNDLVELKKQFEEGKVPSALKHDAESKLSEMPRLAASINEFKWQVDLYQKATKEKSIASLKRLMRLRKGYQYEQWEIVDVIDPLEELNGK